jgi:outer membrane protein TolC
LHALPATTRPPEKWDLRLLTLAAFYFNSELETARAQVATAQAAIVTAGMKPNLTLTVSPGIPSPYLLDLSFAIPVVTAGKRKYQIQAARNLTEAAGLNLTQTAWTARRKVRTALLDVLVAERSEDSWRAQEGLQSGRVARLESVSMPARSRGRPSILRAPIFSTPALPAARPRAESPRRELHSPQPSASRRPHSTTYSSTGLTSAGLRRPRHFQPLKSGAPQF